MLVAVQDLVEKNEDGNAYHQRVLHKSKPFVLDHHLCKFVGKQSIINKKGKMTREKRTMERLRRRASISLCDHKQPRAVHLHNTATILSITRRRNSAATFCLCTPSTSFLNFLCEKQNRMYVLRTHL